MMMKSFVAALLIVPSLAMSAQARSNEGRALPQAYEEGRALPQAYETGREVAAPPWSAACMNDHGPSQCDEPMWVYGSPQALMRYKKAF